MQYDLDYKVHGLSLVLCLTVLGLGLDLGLMQ